MYKYILNIVLLTCLVSCKPDKGKDVPEIDLHHSVVLDEDQLLLGKVKDMSWENDSVLVIVDSNQDGFLHFVHLSDKKVSEYGKIGQGPDEFLLVGAVYPDMNNRPILFDVSKKECFMMQHGDEAADEDSMDRLTEQFLSEHGIRSVNENAAPETADDYLDLAEQAASKKKCIEYLRKALELEPDNVDAQLQLIVHTMEHKVDEQLPALQKLMETAAKQLEPDGYFKEDVGAFWEILETRPYMRVCYTYFDALISCGIMHRAIDEGQRLLELCENDNLGVRYQLMHLYAYMEDEMHALALHKQFDSYEETQMLLPLAVLYYKLNQFDKAEDYIKRLSAVNKDAKKFLRAAAQDRLEDYFDQLNPFGYQPFTMEELLEELMRSSYLFDSVPYFFAWASSRLRTQTAAKKKSTGNAGRNKKS